MKIKTKAESDSGVNQFAKENVAPDGVGQKNQAEARLVKNGMHINLYGL
jgi:hypothetical protein